MKSFQLAVLLILSTILISCDKKKDLPTVSTVSISNLSTSGCTSGGNIMSDGGATVTARGICWSTALNPTVSNFKTSDGTGTGIFTSSLSGLDAGTNYHIRAYATNSVGTAYGNDIPFTTIQILIPTVTTDEATSVTFSTAVSGGNVTDAGNGTISARGVCWSTTQNPTTADSLTSDGTGTGAFISSLTGLTAGTTYYVRAYATNSAGTSYGNDVSFTTSIVVVSVPSVHVDPAYRIASDFTETSIQIISDGGLSLNEKGICWSTSPSPTTANSKLAASNTDILSYGFGFEVSASTTYYLRGYATNSMGTGYSNEITFTTPVSAIDFEGNVYKTIIIGSQVWMAENLKSTIYNDGTTIPLVTDDSQWAALTTPGYCWYNNDAASYKSAYGGLYNWFTVNTGKLCPTAWHVPSDAEWTTLIAYLGGESVAGGKLKEMGISHWSSPNTDATNESGFTALPSGMRNNLGSSVFIGTNCDWWSTLEYDATSTVNRELSYNNGNVYRGPSIKIGGFSVRCLKD